MLPFAPQIDIDHAYHGICLEWKKTTSITDNRANQDIIHIEEWKVASNRNQSGIRVVLTLDRFAFSLAVNFPLSSTPVDFMFPMNTVRFGEGEPWSCIQKNTSYTWVAKEHFELGLRGEAYLDQIYYRSCYNLIVLQYRALIYRKWTVCFKEPSKFCLLDTAIACACRGGFALVAPPGSRNFYSVSKGYIKPS